MNPTVLIVDDDKDFREALCDTLELGGFEVVAAEDGEQASDLFSENRMDLVISDVQMRRIDGNALLRRLKSTRPDVPVLLMTAYGSIPAAVQAMREGAADYLVKPFESEVLINRVTQLVPRVAGTAHAADFVAVDPRTLEVFDLARRIAESDGTVLLTGESGTGKEVMFRHIHAHSRRACGPAIAVNCAAIPENMLEAILFGYEKGAFTGAYKSSPGKFEQAQGGTLLLDEVSEMSLALQAKLLRVLQEKEVERLGSQRVLALDVRVVATSNRDLRTQVSEGRLREDLYYRLNVFPVRVPALRERRADIVPLAVHLLARAVRANGTPVPRLSTAAATRLREYAWPGNVRELDNVMQRALILHRGEIIEDADLQFEQIATAPATATPAATATGHAADTLTGDLRAHERRLIIDALAEGNGSRKFAAEKLGLSPRTLRYKIARLREIGCELP